MTISLSKKSTLLRCRGDFFAHNSRGIFEYKNRSGISPTGSDCQKSP